MRWKAVCRLACRLPEVEEGKSYGVWTLRARGSFIARLDGDGKSMLLKVTPGERDALVRGMPATFSCPKEPWNSALMVVSLASVQADDLWPVLVSSWRRSVPASLAMSAELDGLGP